ncbi:MAG: Fe-S cluster assembly ATPase SufC [Candidatus Bipolaricaulota bacterium]|nr:Fe-S cluster assembly ATPase SufC [Candidatus Bipolaricaulota bacterium]
MAEALEIKDLHVSVEGKEILKGVTLTVKTGEVHSIMGPNGSGKSTLALALMGHPKYEVTGGEVLFKGQNILELEPDERARLGLFLAFQYPLEIQGVPLGRFLWAAKKALLGQSEATNGKPDKKADAKALGEFRKELKAKLGLLKLDESFGQRYLNVGFSGGEKKRAEIVQMHILKPQIAIMDETDSGLDIDSVKIVAEAINQLRGPEFGALVITHYQRILNFLRPDYVHVMADGRIVRSGDYRLAQELEAKGYDWILKEQGVS